MKNTTKYLIEMELPEGMDASTVLELAQEFAVEAFENHAEDEDVDHEEITDAVSVSEVPAVQTAAMLAGLTT